MNFWVAAPRPVPNEMIPPSLRSRINRAGSLRLPDKSAFA